MTVVAVIIILVIVSIGSLIQIVLPIITFYKYLKAIYVKKKVIPALDIIAQSVTSSNSKTDTSTVSKTKTVTDINTTEHNSTNHKKSDNPYRYLLKILTLKLYFKVCVFHK